MSLSAGIYAARAIPIVDDKLGEVGVRFGESEEKHTPFAQVLCQVVRGPAAGQTITWSGYFAGGATDHTIKALRNFGFVGDELSEFQDQRPENEVSIVVEMKESRNGRSYPTVSWVNSPNRGMKIERPIEGKELRRFSAEFKAHLKSAPAIKGAPAKLEAPSAAHPEETGSVTGGDEDAGASHRGYGDRPRNDDDIPF